MSAFLKFTHSQLATIQGVLPSTWGSALVAVALRFLARRMSKAGLWYDDYLILIGLICGLGLWLNNVMWISTNRSDIDYDEMYSRMLKRAFISNVIWPVTLSSIKFSILLLYWRLFAERRRPRWIIRALCFVTFCWGVLAFFLAIFQCKPISASWNSIYASCIPIYGEFSILHIAIDVVILLAPLPMMLGLELRLKQKLMLCGLFGVGGFVTIVSGLRLKYLLIDKTAETFMSYEIKVAKWTSVEIHSAIICACLCCLRPLISFMEDKIKAFQHRKRSVRRGTKLLTDMLPRGRQKEAPTHIQDCDISEYDAMNHYHYMIPQEIDTNQRPLPEIPSNVTRPEMAAVDIRPELLATVTRPVELPGSDSKQMSTAERRDYPMNMV